MGQGGHTVLGLLALVCWASTVAFARRLQEELGLYTASCLVFLVSGVVGCGVVLARRSARRALGAVSRRYWLGCGGLFVAYMVTLYLALGLAADRTQVLIVGVINYLWPGLTLLLSAPLLGHRARRSVWVGLLVAFGGVALAMMGQAEDGPAVWAALRSNQVSYGLALAAAGCWALYSNLNRRWAGATQANASVVFLLATGLLLGVMRLGVSEQSNATTGTWLRLAYQSAVPTLLGYWLWEKGTRRGDMVVLASASFMTPLMMLAISCVVLSVLPRWTLWTGCVLVVAGAVVCRWSVRPGGDAGKMPAVPG